MSDYLTAEEQEKLRAIIAKRNSQAEIVKRAFVLLSLDENRLDGRLSDEEIRAGYRVGQLRRRVISSGVCDCWRKLWRRVARWLRLRTKVSVRYLKKRVKAVAGQRMDHSECRCRLGLRDGSGIGCL